VKALYLQRGQAALVSSHIRMHYGWNMCSTLQGRAVTRPPPVDASEFAPLYRVPASTMRSRQIEHSSSSLFRVLMV